MDERFSAPVPHGTVPITPHTAITESRGLQVIAIDQCVCVCALFCPVQPPDCVTETTDRLEKVQPYNKEKDIQ